MNEQVPSEERMKQMHLLQEDKRSNWLMPECGLFMVEMTTDISKVECELCLSFRKHRHPETESSDD